VRAQAGNAQERQHGQGREEPPAAIAIGLSEARRAGKKVPNKKSSK
jgi:hypothetical protein